MVGMIELLLATLSFVALPGHGVESPGGRLPPGECIACHQESDAGLVDAWRNSAHGGNPPGADCVACHGQSHCNAAARARRATACTGCHGGPAGPVARSYATSKHGTIASVEGRRWDWQRPLADAGYRAPTCAYCHMHRGNHRVGAAVSPWSPRHPPKPALLRAAREAARAPCEDCHSPRFVDTLFAADARMLEVGRMKVREAAAVAEDVADRPSSDAATRTRLRDLLETMESVHMKNLSLGLAHQSPDYQWWYGQPALDGDLLRIKAVATRVQRQPPADSDTASLADELGR